MHTLLCHSAAGSAPLCTRAVGFIRAMFHHPHITVIPQTRMGFLDALALYEARPDKHYSL